MAIVSRALVRLFVARMMVRIVSAAALVASIAVPAIAHDEPAQAAHTAVSVSADPAEAIRAAAAAFDDAQLRKDAKAMDRFLAADMKFVRGSGRLSDRADFLKGFTDPAVTFEPFVITNRIYIPLGPHAGTIGGEGTIRGKEGGKPFEEHFRYADTFRFLDGRWQVVYIQVTPLK